MSAHDHKLKRLKEAADSLRQALEQLESALVEFEEEVVGESSVRPKERKELDLLSIPEVCQELGMGKSWLYRRLRSGEIPSIKLGRVIKVKRSALEEYLERQAVSQVGNTASQLTNQAQDAVRQVVGQVSQVAEGRTGTAEEPDATKGARRKADKLGVDLSQVKGSGVGGRIIIEDVLNAAN